MTIRLRPAGFAGALTLSGLLALVASGCATQASIKAMDSARDLAKRGETKKAVESYCEAITKLREEGMQKRVPLTLAAIYHRFHTLHALKLVRDPAEAQNPRLEPLRALVRERGEDLDLLGLAFDTASQHARAKEVGGPSEGATWVCVERGLIHAEYLKGRVEEWRTGVAGAEAGAAGRFECWVVESTLARLSCGFYSNAMEQAARDQVEVGDLPRAQQVEAARAGREAAAGLLGLLPSSAELRRLVEEENHVFEGLIPRPDLAMTPYLVDPDMVVPESDFNFREGHARVALAVGELNAGNEARAQRYFLEAFRHLVLAGVCGDSAAGGRRFLANLHAAILEAAHAAPPKASPTVTAASANQRTILDYLSSIFMNLRKLGRPGE
ncbi:MAG: hypothetical protein HYZ53_10900 [Planctomycetes bacterium]|nr:hypothetical protein [Planctomycetota bacterium]